MLDRDRGEPAASRYFHRMSWQRPARAALGFLAVRQGLGTRALLPLSMRGIGRVGRRARLMILANASSALVPARAVPLAP